jgi:membrane-associated protein
MGAGQPEPLGALSLLVESALHILQTNAPAVALLAALAESLVAVGAIVPGGTAVIVAGFTVRQQGVWGWLAVAAAAWIGMTLGAVIDYWLGRLAGRRLIPQGAPWRLATRWRHLLRRSRGFLRRRGWWALVVANLAGPGRSTIAVASGASRWSFRSFLVGQSLASAVWSVLFSGAGYVAAGEAPRLEAVMRGTGLAAAVMLLLAVLSQVLFGKMAQAASRALLRRFVTRNRPPQDGLGPATFPSTWPEEVHGGPVGPPPSIGDGAPPTGSAPGRAAGLRPTPVGQGGAMPLESDVRR